MPKLTRRSLSRDDGDAMNNTAAPTYARINTLKADPGRVIEAWRTEGVDYDFARFDWVGSFTATPCAFLSLFSKW